MTSILSIQSSVAYGYVGNSAAGFALMRMGFEVWPVLTVHFSNHTGYGAWRGPMMSADEVADVVKGIDERGVLGRCDAVLSGFQGGADVAAAILDAVALVKTRNPRAIYCCDPVMGDVDRGFFVHPGIPELMRDAMVPAADVITPNQFELDYLTGTQTSTLSDVLTAADAARALGPATVLVTSVVHDSAPPGTLDMVAVGGEGAWSVTTPLLARTFNGAGDVTAATFLAHLLRTGQIATALGQTAAVVHALLRRTIESGEGELQLVAAQDEMANPSRWFEVVSLR